MSDRGAAGRDLPEHGSVSVVVEWDNAEDIRDGAAMENLMNLGERIVEALDVISGPPRLVVVSDPEVTSRKSIRTVLRQLRQYFGEKFEILSIDAPGGKYTDQKIAGVAATESDIIVFADSDCHYRPKWLCEILAPLRDPDVDFAHGRNVMMVDSFWGKAAAVYWFYPIEAEVPHGPTFVYFSNLAIRRDAYRKHPFPGNPGNRVACAIWVRALPAHDFKGVPTMATADHPPAHGMANVIRKAVDYGRIDDGRYAARNMGRIDRLLRAVVRLFREILHSLKRSAYVGWKLRLNPVTALGTLGVGLVYAVVSGLTQIRAALFESPAIPKVAETGDAAVAQTGA
jgi:urease gamma subunit